ncbi:MAG: hypothetical protein IID41_18140 [Planctomycetes bacterium]|nr:hypothetical protein [Planctomycetota bacterium]
MATGDYCPPTTFGFEFGEPKGERCPHCGYCPHCGRSNPAPPRPHDSQWHWNRPFSEPFFQYDITTTTMAIGTEYVVT